MILTSVCVLCMTLLNPELHEECSRNLPEQLGLQVDAIGEQQLKWTQSGSSSRNRGTVERGAAAEADTIGEQQLKQIDAIREQQLKQTQLGSSSSTKRAVRCRITHVGEVAERAKLLVELCLQSHNNLGLLAF